LQELQVILDQEISHLPTKYALPLVLCYLEGKTNAQAAAQLGWPEGSMSRRLSRARELLRSRLARRGLALSVALIASVFSQRADAAVSPELAASTIKASLRVAEGEAVKDVVGPATAALLEAALAGAAATSRLAVSALAIVALVIALAAIGFQVGAPAFAANLFLGGKAPHAFTRSPSEGSTLSTAAGGGCGSMSAVSTGCGTTGGCGSAAE
jgi:hypothetical protein